jgi:serine/threonine-protein kinase
VDLFDVGVRPGDVLAGKYRVERVVGVGGMGVVVAAHHIALDETVALKFLLPEALKSQEAVARFVREARAAVKIKSEHVARVSDVGQLENGTPYMVMEYLAGGDLGAWLKQRGPMPVETAVDFVLQACEAIADAHVLGIVHRDLKPANLFCVQRSDGQLSIKVLDFGISKLLTPGVAPGGRGHEMTSTSAIVGSPMYMSPEQLQSSKGVDVRTDIWSLGVILFELLTARVPFDAEAVTELIIKIATAPAPPVRSVRPDIPAGLEQVIARSLEKDRDRRFSSVGELAVALRDFGSYGARLSVERVVGTLRAAGMLAPQEAVSDLHPASPAATARSGPMRQTVATWDGHTQTSTSGRSKVVWAVLGAIAALGVAVGGVVAVRRTTAAGSRSVAPLAAETSAPSALPAAAATSADPAASLEPERHDLPVPSPPSASSAEVASPPPAHGAARPASRTPRPSPAAAGPTSPSPAAAAPSPPATSPAAAKPNCNPPFVIDSAGHRQYKPECL